MGEVLPGTSGGAVRARWPPAGFDLGRWRHLVRDRAEVLALVTIVGVGAAIRFATLGAQSFDHDESVTAVAILHPGLPATLVAVANLERSPPLYYILVWLWSKAFGAGVLDLRALSAILGTLTVAIAFLAGRELATRRAGLVAAALVALNPFLIWYSQEARSYALLVFLSALAFLFFARALRRPSRGVLALWAAVSALALCSHYFAVFLIVPEGIWLIAVAGSRRWALGAVGTTAAVGLALLPLATIQEGRAHLDAFTKIPVFTRGWQALVHFAASARPETIGTIPQTAVVQATVGIAAGALALAAVAIIWRRGAREERRGALIVAAVALASLVIPTALALAGVDYLDARNLIGAVVPLLVAAGIAFGARRAGRAGLAAAAACCALFVGVLVAVGTLPQMQRADWREAAQAIGPRSTDRVIVAPQMGRYPLAYYLNARRFRPGYRPVWARQLDLLTEKRRVLAPGPPFHLVSERPLDGHLFKLWRYRAPRPVPIKFGSVAGPRMIHQPSAVLTTGPTSGSPFAVLTASATRPPHGV